MARELSGQRSAHELNQLAACRRALLDQLARRAVIRLGEHVRLALEEQPRQRLAIIVNRRHQRRVVGNFIQPRARVEENRRNRGLLAGALVLAALVERNPAGAVLADVGARADEQSDGVDVARGDREVKRRLSAQPPGQT